MTINKLKKNYLIIMIILSFAGSKNSFSENIFNFNAEKIEYKKENNVVIASGNAIASDSLGKKIFSEKIVYYKDKNVIKTFKKSKFTNGEYELNARNFVYDINSKNIQALGNVLLIDKNKNKFSFDKFNFNHAKLDGSGENIKVKTFDGQTLYSKNGYINRKQNTIKLRDGKYTTCLKIENDKKEFCPSWSLNSSEIIHDKENKRVKHKNAILKVKKIPIFYTPYASHPDPSVKRQSGFLPPVVKTISNIGRTIQVPYFWAIDKHKDITITPTYYFNEYDLLKTSYRQAFKNGYLKIENGYSKGYKRLNKTSRTKGSRNYFFVEHNLDNPNILYQENKIKFKIQRISQQNFARVNKINTSLFNEDIRSLENSLEISSNENNKFFNAKIGIFENLDVLDNSKYTYYLPDGKYSFNTKKLKNFNTNFTSYFQGKKFSKNQKQAKIRNKISVDSKKIILKNKGISSQFKFALYNNNIYNDNVTNLKQNTNIDNYFTFASDNTLPLVNFSKNSYQVLSPRIFAKYTTGKMQNASNNDKVLNYSDVFSMNRVNNLDTPEVGASIGHGFDYSFNKNFTDSKNTFLKANFGLGQVVKDTRKDNMPITSSLNNKNSDLVGYMKFDIFGKERNFRLGNNKKEKLNFLNFFESNFLSVDYNFNLENDFSEFTQNNINLKGNYKNFYSSFTYKEKNNHVGSDKSSGLILKKLIKNNYYFNFEGKKNLKEDNTESLNFGINYENDCILTSLKFSKNFYYDNDLSSGKNLIFGITLKPFSDDISPDLNSFIN